MHNGLINTAKVNSNPLTPKTLITNWISIISKNYYDFLVDTNEHFSQKIAQSLLMSNKFFHIMYSFDCILQIYVKSYVSEHKVKKTPINFIGYTI